MYYHCYGAGGDLNSPFIQKYFNLLAEKDFMTVSFNFYYQDIGRKIPDKNEKCQQTYLGIINYLLNEEDLSEENIVLAGKSMGGRIATEIAPKTKSKHIIILGYPLHPPGKPEKMRDSHLYKLKQKILFIQGENDAFGNQKEMESVVRKINNAQLLIIKRANHSLNIPKKYQITPSETEKTIINSVKSFLKK